MIVLTAIGTEARDVRFGTGQTALAARREATGVA